MDDLFQNGVSRRRNRVTLIAFFFILSVLLLATVWMIAPYFLAVFMGLILSIVFRRIYDFLRANGFGPRVAALSITVGEAVLIVAPIVIFGTMAVMQGIETAQALHSQPTFSFEGLSKFVTRWKPLKEILGSANEVQEQAREGLKNVASMAPGVVFKIFGGLPEFILQAVLALISCYFFLMDGQRFMHWLRDKLPLDPEVRGAISTSFRETAVAAIVSTLTAASVQTVIMSVAYLVLNVPAAFLAGGATFFLAWVPLVGSTPVWIVGAIYLLVKGKIIAMVAMLGFGVLTGLSDNFVYPWVLKGRGEMHPLVSLVAIFGGIQLFGVLGVFIGPIVASLLIAVLNIWPLIAERFGFLPGTTILTPTQATSVVGEPVEAVSHGIILPPGLSPIEGT